MGTAPASARPTDPGSRVGSLREGAQRSQNRTTSLQLTNDSRTDGAQQRGAGEMCFPASKRQPTNKVRPLLDGGCTKAHSAECAPVHRSQNRTTSLQLMNDSRADGSPHRVPSLGAHIWCPHWVPTSGALIGSLHWVPILGAYIGCLHWVPTSGALIGSLHREP